MTMISEVNLIQIQPRITTPDVDGYLPAGVHGCAVITGNYLVTNGGISLINREAETLIIATPMMIDDESLIHLSFGTENRRVAHTITIEGLETIAGNLSTIAEIARLERKEE